MRWLSSRQRGRNRERQPGASRQRGMVLVAALWVLLLLSMLAVSYSLTARTNVTLARNIVGAAAAEALADAGVHRIIAGLAGSSDPPPFRLDGTPYAWAFGNGLVRMALDDEGGKIDINVAEPKLLSALMQTVGIRAKQADALAAAIDTYRKLVSDENDAGRNNETGGQPAAKTAGADQASRPAGAADTESPNRSMAFALVEELLRVPGVSGDLYQRIAPFLTIYTGAETPEEDNAAPEVVMALHIAESGGAGGGAGVKQAELQARLDQRRSQLGDAVHTREQGSLGGGSAAAGSPRSLLGDSAAAARQGNGTVLVHAEAMTEGGSVFVREAVIRVSLEQSPPYVILAWRHGRRWLFPLEASAAG